jgi:hypothetical protein
VVSSLADWPRDAEEKKKGGEEKEKRYLLEIEAAREEKRTGGGVILEHCLDKTIMRQGNILGFLNGFLAISAACLHLFCQIAECIQLIEN